MGGRAVIARWKCLVVAGVVRSIELIAAVIAQWEKRKKGRRRRRVEGKFIGELVDEVLANAEQMNRSAIELEESVADICGRVEPGSRVSAELLARQIGRSTDELVEWAKRVRTGGDGTGR